MPFCAAFLASRTRRFWFPCSPQHSQAVCVPGARQQPGCAFPAAREGFCLPALLSLSLHAGSGLCCSRLLHSSSGELSAFSSLPGWLTMQHMKLWSTELCHLKGLWVFCLSLSGCFFFYFLPRELFSRGEQPVSYSDAGCKLSNAYKIKLVLLINPLVHYLLFAIFHVYKLFTWFFFINLIFNQSVTSIDLPSHLVYNDNFLQDTFLSMSIVDTPSVQQITTEADVLMLLHT